MCEQCETLREENRQLRDMLFGAAEELDETALRLTARQRVLYRVMLRWPIAAHDILEGALVAASPRGHELRNTRAYATVQIYLMRRRLAPAGIKIENVRGLGYRLIREAA